MKKTRKGSLYRLVSMLLMAAALSMLLTAGTSAAVKLSKKKVTLVKGQTVTLKVTGTKKKVTWKTSKKSVATVKKGLVTAKKKGTATITAKIGSKSLKCKVTVEAPKLNKKEVSLKVGKKVTLKLSGTKQKVKWASSDKKIAKVSSKGKVTALKGGTAEISATVLKKAFICKVTVEEPEQEPEESERQTESEQKQSEQEAAPTTSDFLFARDCTVTPGEKTINIEFKINKDSVTEDELKAAGYTVNDGVASMCVNCETATYKFRNLPKTLDDIKSIPITNMFGPVAASICACAAFDGSQGSGYNLPIFDMMDYLNGPKLEINNVAKSDIYQSVKATLSYGKYAYFNGATPTNGYVPTKPYTFTLVHGPYYIPAKSSTIAHPEGEPERHMILLSFEGDESQRYVDVYKSGSGNWYTWDKSWQHLIASMKVPSSTEEW